MKLKQKKLLTLPEQIVESVKEAILDGDLKKGDKLPSEKELADTFEVSRPTVRDALKLLSASKLITTKPGAKGGHYITDISRDSFINDFSDYISLSLGLEGVAIDELVEFRKLIEIQSCVLAAQRRTDADLVRLKELLPKSNEPLSDYEYFERDFEFHRTIAAATHNTLFIVTVESITNVLNLFRSLTVSNEIKEGHTSELYDIYKALEQKDPNMAYESMSHHLRHTEESFSQNKKQIIQGSF